MEKLTCSLPDDNEEFIEGDSEMGGDNEDEGKIDHFKHNQLLEAVRTIGGKKSATGLRTEATLTVSENNLSNDPDNKIDIGDLLSSLDKTSKLSTLRQKVLKPKRKGVKVLPPPLLKPETERIQRTVAYESVCSEVSKWDKIVEQNRQADQLTFPLKQPNIFVEPMNKVVQRFKLRTPLEMEMAALLQERNSEVTRGDELYKLEKEKKQLALQEAMLKRSEMRKLRALQSYREAKNKRRNKIKSKSYHRILKKERMKKQLQEFEELQKTDPELAAEKLDEMERLRVEERMSLRHRNTGKWAKYQIIRSKFDKESSRNIQEQLNLNRQLTEKQKFVSDSDDDGEEIVEDATTKSASSQNLIPRLPFGSSANPWMSGDRKLASSDDDTMENALEADNEEISNFRKYWNEINERKASHMQQECEDEGNEAVTEENDEIDEIFSEIQKQQKFKKAVTTSNVKKEEINNNRIQETEEAEEEDDEEESQLDEMLVRKRRLEDFEDIQVEKLPKVLNRPKKLETKSNTKSQSKTDVAIDPNDFITVKEKVIEFRAPDMSGYQEDAIDDEPDVNGDNHMTIAEAFANDDVVSDFRSEKQALIDKGRPQDIDLTLPGWGQWGGTGIKVSKAKRRRFTIKAPPAPVRKDSEIGNVIINEAVDDKLKAHLVSAIPKAFNSARDYKRSLKLPIGKHWNPETAYARLIAPKVVTKMGQVIEPMDQDAIKESTQKRHRNPRSRSQSSNVVN